MSRTAASPLVPPRARAFLYGAWALFILWIGYLLVLVLTTTRPVVLSRPQFLVSGLDVIADLEGAKAGDAVVKVRQVHWPANAETKKLEGETIQVTNLEDCTGWHGAGTYILPLVPLSKGSYQVVRTPPSPGFEPLPTTDVGRPHIYPATPETLQQLAAIPKPKLEVLHQP